MTLFEPKLAILSYHEHQFAVIWFIIVKVLSFKHECCIVAWFIVIVYWPKGNEIFSFNKQEISQLCCTDSYKTSYLNIYYCTGTCNYCFHEPWTYILRRSCSICINFFEEGVCKLSEGIEVFVWVEVCEEVCERRHITSSRRAARSAVGCPSFCWGIDSAGLGVPATLRAAAASLRSDAFSLNRRSFSAFKLSTSLVNRSFMSIKYFIRLSISSIFAFFLSREVCAATRFFSFLVTNKQYDITICKR